jgi:hypothetical protein
VQQVQDAGEPAPGRHPPAAGYADLETRGRTEMPIVQERPLRAAGAHDQVDRDVRNHALHVGASG